jgi:N-acetylmuramoyl-L-alanine amidase
MKALAAVAIFGLSWVAAAPGQSEREPLHTVSAVRHWTQGDVTRVAVEISGSFLFRTDRLHSPERVYFDILNSLPRVDGHRYYTEELIGSAVKRIRVAETTPGTTRVVLELAAESLDVHTSELVNPNRLIIEVRPQATPVTPSLSESAAPRPAAIAEQPRLSLAPVLPSAPPPKTDMVARVTETSPVAAATAPATSRLATATPPAPAPIATAPSPAIPAPAPVRTESVIAKPAQETPRKSPSPDISTAAPKAARHTSGGDTSLVRALGLKIQRVVIDPGHGGHDQGTEGPHGLLEKDLVLDLSQRLGKLIEDHMGAEVIYTRTDDTFIPLEGRTALANEKKADLFLSIHANSSPVPRITGVETYYLSLTDSKEAKDVAARENDSSQLSVFELRDLVQKIELNDKVQESREFASRIQSAMFAFSARSFPSEKNRGVKKAPFVVLIGAHMPSVLAEIGFLSNPREEALLKRPDYRQKLADALYRGVSRYADSLSHFQLAQQSSSESNK